MSTIDDKYIHEMLERLLKTPSPTGYTDEVTRLCCEELQKLGVPYEITRRGAIRARIQGGRRQPALRWARCRWGPAIRRCRRMRAAEGIELLGVLDEQLAAVLDHWKLPLRFPRCMACGGALRDATDAERAWAPDTTRERYDEFWTCTRCGQLFWRGGHWDRITDVLAPAQRARG